MTNDKRTKNMVDATNDVSGIQNYKKLIIELINNISDIWLLKQIYRCIKNVIEEG